MKVLRARFRVDLLWHKELRHTLFCKQRSTAKFITAIWHSADLDNTKKCKIVKLAKIKKVSIPFLYRIEFIESGNIKIVYIPWNSIHQLSDFWCSHGKNRAVKYMQNLANYKITTVCSNIKNSEDTE